MPSPSPKLSPSPGLSPGPINFYFKHKPEPGAEPRIELWIEPGFELEPKPEPRVEPEPEPGLYLLFCGSHGNNEVCC